jgi:hypothetical protein
MVKCGEIPEHLNITFLKDTDLEQVREDIELKIRYPTYLLFHNIGSLHIREAPQKVDLLSVSPCPRVLNGTYIDPDTGWEIRHFHIANGSALMKCIGKHARLLSHPIT